MKVSELKLDTIKQYLRVDGNDDDILLDALLASSISYCISYMGCTKQDLDKYPDVTIVILSLISDSYEVRQFTTSTITLNPTMQGVLDLHCGNFLADDAKPIEDSITSDEIKTYNIIWGLAVPGAVNSDRGYLTYNPHTGFGKIHLDMIVTKTGSGNGGVLCTLPNDAPVPTTLLEVSIDSNNNSVYLEPNRREIKGWGVQGNNKRYILDLVGFFK
nr:MAG TPA: hypothetical protein [Caudoviricetes sp.]